MNDMFCENNALPFSLLDQNDWLHEKRNTTDVADDVLRTIDHLSITLDQLRDQIDELESQWPPSAA